MRKGLSKSLGGLLFIIVGAIIYSINFLFSNPLRNNFSIAIAFMGGLMFIIGWIIIVVRFGKWASG
jgi:uncharacterized membrane protein YgdD (TMEM256/DUF423 family)